MSFRLRTKMSGVDKVARRIKRAGKVSKAHVRKRLSHWGRVVVSSIKGDSGLFNDSRGRLQQSLYTRQKEQSRVVTQELGWRVPYGEFVEFGPVRARVWEIKPKGWRADITSGRGGAGVALKTLRFTVKTAYKISRGKRKGQVGLKSNVVYATKVIHRWTEAERRPHFEPWLDHHRRFIAADLASIVPRVIKGELT